MPKMRAFGTRDELWQQLATPEVAADLGRTEHVRGKMYPYQYAAIYQQASRCNGGNILEIGAFLGRATLVLALAAPEAMIVSLEPYLFVDARDNTSGCDNVTIVKQHSWHYLRSNRQMWDMILVDGNHRRIKEDLPWFNRLADGGLILLHDYTPPRYPFVFNAVNDMAVTLRRFPDVLIVDDRSVGMVGFYRRGGEEWAP